MQCKDSTSDGFEQDPPVCSLPKGSTCGEKRAEENGLEDGRVSDTWGMVREGNTYYVRGLLSQQNGRGGGEGNWGLAQSRWISGFRRGQKRSTVGRRKNLL
ncbi:hypothetical protein HMPREF1556_01454, partial [Porphyromonas sp. oral taxon 278 str. W7784]